MTTTSKSIITAAAIIGGIVFITPAIYNNNINKLVKQEQTQLQQIGINLKLTKNNDSYFTANRKYEATIDNVIMLIKKLNPQIPTYKFDNISQILNGSKFTINLKMLKYPIYHKNAIIISFDKPNKKILQTLQKAAKTNKPAKQILNFLTQKNIVLYMNISSNSIDSARVKDINFKMDNDDNWQTEQIEFQTNGLKFKFDKNTLNTSLKTIKIAYNEIYKSSGHKYGFNLTINNFKNSNTRKGLLNQNSSTHIDNVLFKNFNYFNGNTIIKMNGINLSSKFNNVLKNANFTSKNSVQTFYIKNKKGSLKLQNFIYNLSLLDMNANTIKSIVNKLQNNPNSYNNMDTQKLATEFIHHGLIIKIDPISVNKLSFTSNMGTYKFDKINIVANASIKQNNVSLYNVQTALIPYLNASLKLNTTQSNINEIEKIEPDAKMILQKYIKKSGNNIYTNILFKNGHLYINGRKTF